MTITPEQLLEAVTQTVSKQQTWVEALIFEKLGFNWNTVNLNAGEHDLYFQQPYAAGRDEYIVHAKVFTPQGDPSEDIGFVLKEQHEAYFKVWVSDACVFSYLAFNPQIEVTQ